METAHLLAAAATRTGPVTPNEGTAIVIVILLLLAALIARALLRAGRS